MRSTILVVLSALSLVLSAPLPASLQTRNLDQVNGPRAGTTPGQPWQGSEVGDSNRARALSPGHQRRDDGDGEVPSSNNVDGGGDDSVTSNPQPDNGVLVAGGLLFGPVNDLSLQQTQYINTMLNKFGPDGPGTLKEAQMVAEFAKVVARRNALTPEETKAALNSIFDNFWENNLFLKFIRAWTGTWKD